MAGCRDGLRAPGGRPAERVPRRRPSCNEALEETVGSGSGLGVEKKNTENAEVRRDDADAPLVPGEKTEKNDLRPLRHVTSRGAKAGRGVDCGRQRRREVFLTLE